MSDGNNPKRDTRSLRYKDQACMVRRRDAAQEPRRRENWMRKSLQRAAASLDYKHQARAVRRNELRAGVDQEELQIEPQTSSPSVILITDAVPVGNSTEHAETEHTRPQARRGEALKFWQRGPFLLFVVVIALLGIAGIAIGLPMSNQPRDPENDKLSSIANPTSTIAPTEPAASVPSNSPSQIPTMIPFLNSSYWNQMGQPIDGEHTRDELGYRVDMSADGSIIATRDRDYVEDMVGRVLVYQYNNTDHRWHLLGQPLVGEFPGDQFGYSISLSPNGKSIAAGSVSNSRGGKESGSVRVFSRVLVEASFDTPAGYQWTQQGQELHGAGPYDGFGWAVALSYNGSVVAVGAEASEREDGESVGHVQVFEYVRQGNFWRRMGEEIPGTVPQGGFGTAVAISSDGRTVASGSRFSGLIQVYSYNETNEHWNEPGERLEFDESECGPYVYSVDLSWDGTVVASGYSCAGTGYVKVFELNNTTWTQRGQTLRSTSIEGASDSFGISVALSSGGDILAVGDDANNENGESAGHVQLFIFDFVSKNWTLVHKHDNGMFGRTSGDYFGRAVALSSDGERVAVGAYGSDFGGYLFGQVRVFERR